MVHEQAHLHDGQRTALLAVTVLHQTALFLPLEEVVRQVIVDDTGVALPQLEAALVHVRLDLVELRRQQGQCPIDLLKGALRLLEEHLRVLQR